MLKTVGTATTEYVYGAAGELVSEYGGNAPVATLYLTADHLGSTRMVTNGSGTVTELRDYAPFGEELGAGVGPRPTGSALYTGLAYPSVTADANKVNFTSKERDAESGLDFFGARYMSSAQGRFTSPDPIHIMPQKLLDPRQWNMYAYVRNNPLRLIDPTGMYVCGGTERECKDFEGARQRDLKSKTGSVHDAASAYGAAGDQNGVNVRFGDPGKNKAGNVTAGLEADPNHPGLFRATADVVIRAGQSGTALDATVGHEGAHIEDAQQFAATITPDGHYDLSKNLTSWQTEMHAYGVTAAIQGASGRAASYGVCGTGNCIYGPGMTQPQINSTTMMLLANPANAYNRFIDVGRVDGGVRVLDNELGRRQFPDVTK